MRAGRVYEIRGPVNAYVTTTYDELNRLREVFVSVGKAGTTLNSMFQAVGRLISVALRRHPDLAERFVKTLEGIESGEFYSCNNLRGRSLPDMIAQIMKHALATPVTTIPDKNNFDPPNTIPKENGGDFCPGCGGLSLRRSGGCKQCSRCGYTTC